MSMKMPGLRAVIVAGLWVLLVLAPGVARAQSCSVHGASFAMNFGNVTPAGADSYSQITYVCQAPASQQQQVYFFRLCLFLGPGDFSEGKTSPRRMKLEHPPSFLEYDLYSNSARTDLIGDVGDTGKPVYQLQMEVATNQYYAVSKEDKAFIYGKVHPGQARLAGYFHEEGINGQLKYLYSTTAVPVTADCSDGISIPIGPNTVRAYLDNSCGFSATDLNFGTVDTLAKVVEATSTIYVDCSANENWTLGLGNGRYYDGTRHMGNGVNRISYELYSDQNRTVPWGNTDAGNRLTRQTDPYGNPVTVTVYGRVPAQTDVPPGRYTDTVIVTLYH